MKCPKCHHMDATHIHQVVNGKVQLECNRCNTNRWYDSKELQGKLSWKLDCPARWNLYKIDVETFSKIHLAPKSTFVVAQFVSKHFYGGNIPVPVKYGIVQLDKEISYNLIKIPPPTKVVQFIRRILGQPQGLRLSILLSLFPIDYLRIIQIALDFYTNMHLPVKEHSSASDSIDENTKLALKLSKSSPWVNLTLNSISL